MSRPHLSRLAGLLGLVVLLPFGEAGAANERLERLGRRIEARREKAGVPSLAVVVARRGRILWEAGFGLADRERGLPATPHTPYSLASASKPLTATALMVLVERGDLSLDRPVNDYLGPPALTARIGDSLEATVRRIANHTAGLPLHYHFFPAAGPVSRPPPEESRRRYGVLVRPPGERYGYSNFGYAVLEHVIEDVSDSSFSDFLRREVFLPLGMRDSSLPVDETSLPDNAAPRYDRNGDRLPFYDFDHRGASAVFASAHDLARFGLFHLGTVLSDQRSILASVARREMQQPTAAQPDGAAYGIGWTIRENRGGYRLISHSGGMPGVTTSLRLVPEAGAVVVVLANARTDLVFEVSDLILRSILPASRLRPIARDELPGTPPQLKRTRSAPKRLRGSWEGHIDTWEAEIPIRLILGKRLANRAWIANRGPFVLSSFHTGRGELTALIHGEMPGREAGRERHVVRLVLILRGQRLTGAATALSFGNLGDLPRALSHWVELERSAGRASAQR